MKIAVIINSSAGVNNSGDEVTRIKAAFNQKAVDVQLFEVSGEELKRTVEEAAISGFDAVTAAGGDGTINAVVNIMIKKDIAFGIIPLGTLNHFAKDAGIPLEIEDAVEVIAKNKIHKVDVAEVNGHYFLNNSSVGVYPKMVKHRDKEMEELGYSKWYAMFRALLNIFKKLPMLTFRIQTENHLVEVRTPFVFVGNNEYAFDLFNLGKRERVDEGVLSLYYPKTTGKFSMIRFAFLALINKLNETRDFYNTKCNEIKINSGRKILEVSADGEVLHLEPPLKYKLHPGKLNLLLP
jgi:YegS/Rv2252/BmrU family lipid kinase